MDKQGKTPTTRDRSERDHDPAPPRNDARSRRAAPHHIIHSAPQAVPRPPATSPRGRARERALSTRGISTMLKRLGAVLALLAALVLGFGSSAMAANPHFVQASAAKSGGALVVDFKIAGLGKNETLTVTANAYATATYACVNKGGKIPSDPKKTDVSGNTSAFANLTSDKNGQITGTLTLQPPASTLSCPPGQTDTLLSVTYSNVTVSAGGETVSIPGTF